MSQFDYLAIFKNVYLNNMTHPLKTVFFENVLVVIFLEIWLVGISSGPIDAV